MKSQGSETDNRAKVASDLTPAMKQYMELKSRYQDSILFFRMGDFYEMFFEDAVIASKLSLIHI